MGFAVGTIDTYLAYNIYNTCITYNDCINGTYLKLQGCPQ